MNYKRPGVYVDENSKFPPSVAQVETAIPAFIGYTEKAIDTKSNDITNKPKRITSIFDYERFFGKPQAEPNLTVTITESNDVLQDIQASINVRSKYLMHYGLQMFYANGGGPCWIVSVGNYDSGLVGFSELKDGLVQTEKVDEITLYVYPDAQGLDSVDDYYALQTDTIDLCAELQDRFAVMDVWMDPTEPISTIDNNIQMLRDKTPSEVDRLKYGAAYFPNVETSLDFYYGGEGAGEANVSVVHNGGDGSFNGNLSQLKGRNNAVYYQARSSLGNLPLEMPPSPIVVGVYASVDKDRGVWKAPANVNMDFVIKPRIKITDKQQADLNVDSVTGKSVNVIRSFTGRGSAVVWGARTLAGNSNEWRYISVRRFFNMVEESVKKATVQFVFEPNDANTWVKIRAMIENFLTIQWRAGALSGATPEDAFFVGIGLGETMTAVDILEGRMNVEIGMAVVRPAEFIILKFSHKMQES